MNKFRLEMGPRVDASEIWALNSELSYGPREKGLRQLWPRSWGLLLYGLRLSFYHESHNPPNLS
jgi:hypothetical protein